MTQYKGIDTKVEQFAPSRANPVASRHVRSYYAQQPLTGTSTFENLTFQIEQTNPRNVINEMRLVFPLEMRAYSIQDQDDDGELEALPLAMHTNSWSRASNIAVGQNSPFSAFRNLEIAINGKVYSDQFQRYGKCLGQCFQSYSELQFQNDESLKPVANNFTGYRRDSESHAILDPDGQVRRNIRVVAFEPEPHTFSLLENNSGFLARARRFQSQLQDDGMVWKGDISSLFNSSLFNSEARRSGNDQIPYVQSIFVNAVFDNQKSSFDQKYSFLGDGDPENLHIDFEDYMRNIPQKLFEFLTTINSGFPYDQRVHQDFQFPMWYTLKWTAQPRIEIEWVTYSQALLAPAYKLRGLRYQMESTLPFQIPYAPVQEDRNWVTTTMQRQLLAVPNLIYIWVSQTRSSGRDMFGMGGMFRTCDIKQNSLKIRVNGAVDIIQGPSNELLYKWYKRNTASVFEFPTWEKNKIIVISPSEVGLSEWLANQASVSTLDISLETSYSTLQVPEVKQLTSIAEMLKAGYQMEVPATHNTAITGVFPTNEVVENRYHFRVEPSLWGDRTVTVDETEFYVTTQAQRIDHYPNNQMEHDTAVLRVDRRYWENAYGDSTYDTVNGNDSAGQFKFVSTSKVFTSWRHGASYWIIINPYTHEIQHDSSGHVIIWMTETTHVFEPVQLGMSQSIHEVPWTLFANPDNWDGDGPNIRQADFCKDEWDSTPEREEFWEYVHSSQESLQSEVHFHLDEDTYDEILVRSPMFTLNYEDPDASTLEGRFYFRDHGTYTKNLWSISPEVYRIFLKRDTYNDLRVTGMDPFDHPNASHKGSIKRDQMGEGWRWAKMTDPANGFTQAPLIIGTGDYQGDKPLLYFSQYENDHILGLNRPQQVVTCKTEVERGILESSLRSDYTFAPDEFDSYYYLRKYQDRNDDDALAIVNKFDFTLNCLLEYNNETVLLSQDRGKPVHFPNLMFPQGRAALPSQEDSYLAS